MSAIFGVSTSIVTTFYSIIVLQNYWNKKIISKVFKKTASIYTDYWKTKMTIQVKMDAERVSTVE